MMEQSRCHTIIAKVLRVDSRDLLVCDCSTKQEVVVHTNQARCFSSGDCVCIHFSGAMTMSIPPQITATCIKKHC